MSWPVSLWRTSYSKGTVSTRFPSSFLTLPIQISGAPPRGLQFLLGTPSSRALYDTIVMANLGYFQLKATPGAWLLTLREVFPPVH